MSLRRFLVSVKVVSNVARITADNDTNLPLALRFMLNDIQRKSEPFTPKDTGDLRRRILQQVMGKTATITWDVDYAAYQEDIQYKNYTTPGTGPRFAENAVKEVVGNAEFYFRKARLI